MKALISGYYGFGNFGDELILSCLCSHLKSLGVDVSVLSSNPKTTSVDNGVNAFYSFNFKSLPEIILKHDVLISGGGSLLQDVTSKKSLIYYLGVIFLAQLFRKKVLIFAQGIGPINDKFLRFLTRILLKNCSYVSVRDDKSLELLNSWGVNADLVCDPVFSLYLPQYTPKNILGVQLRDFAGLNKNDLEKFAKILTEKYSDKKIQLFSFQDAIDFEISKHFMKLLKQYNENIDVEILHALTYHEIISRMADLEYLFAMRFHALIIALMYGIKSVAINYDIKVEKLAAEADLPLVDIKFDNIDIVEPKTVILSKMFNWTAFDHYLK